MDQVDQPGKEAADRDPPPIHPRSEVDQLAAEAQALRARVARALAVARGGLTFVVPRGSCARGVAIDGGALLAEHVRLRRAVIAALEGTDE